MKLFSTFILLVLVFNKPHDVLGIDADQVGLYFDTSGEAVCAQVEPLVPFVLYLIVTNMSADEFLGIEFSLCANQISGPENSLFRLGDLWVSGCPNPVDIGIPPDLCDSGWVVGCHTATTPIDGRVIVAEFEFLLLEPATVEFFLGPASVQSIDDGLPAYATSSSIVPLGISSGGPSSPVAMANGECDVVSVTQESFGSLKALFR